MNNSSVKLYDFSFTNMHVFTYSDQYDEHIGWFLVSVIFAKLSAMLYVSLHISIYCALKVNELKVC